MEIKTQETTHGDGLALEDEARREQASQTLWTGLAILWQRRRFIAGVTALAAIVSIVVALLMPKWYAGEARVLRSEGGMSIMGMMDRASGGLSRLLGAGGGDYVRYLAILTSRSMLESVVEEFDLVRVYDIEADDDENPLDMAVEELTDNVEFDVDVEFDYLAVRAYDKDPEQAAAMANFIVAQLNEANARLTSQSARESRIFIEQRLRKAESDLDSVRGELQQFQEANGFVELESQAQAFITSMATLKGQVAEAEVRYQTLAQQYGPDNPQVQAARTALQAARRQVNAALGGQDAMLPVSMQELPSMSRRYAELMQDQLIQAEVIENIYPLYEQSLFQERSEASAVQVVDEAVPPMRAAKPSRRMIVVVVTLSAFMLACLFAFAHAWLWQNRAQLAHRLHAASRRVA
ncbi:MAG: Wzz/FepE/Etk N-terminal domain-containing protein [Rhodothermales bacterium]